MLHETSRLTNGNTTDLHLEVYFILRDIFMVFLGRLRGMCENEIRLGHDRLFCFPLRIT
jgi:hypothetical protein